jgi:ribosome biogenesis GTPase
VRLEDIGWDAELERRFAALAGDGRVPARVCRVDRDRLRVIAAAGEFVAVVASRASGGAGPARYPTVGDWCAFRPPESGGPGVIDSVMPRRTIFNRRAAGRATHEQAVAANVDVAFLVTGLDEDYSLRRIERLLALAWESGARPVVVLNKADACDCVEKRLAEVTGAAPGADVIATSAVTGAGLDELRAFIDPCVTVVFLGSSGVGKSTIINRLLGRDRMRTAPVRSDDSRGRHTTTARELIVLPSGGVLIDSPGVREVGMWVGEAALEATFAEIAELAGECRFSDCSHDHEPGCAVRAAVERGDVDSGRLASLHRLRREAANASRRAEEHLKRDFEKRTYGKWRKEMKNRPDKQR